MNRGIHIRAGIVALGICLVAGCASDRNFQSTLTTPTQKRTEVPKPFSNPSSCSAGAVIGACAIDSYNSALKTCLESAQYYQSEIDRSTTNSLLVGLFGTLAGSVFAIGAQGNAAKAWAGLSGAGNAYQTQLDSSSMGAASFKSSKDSIARNVRSLQKKAEATLKAAAPNYPELYAASVNAASACANGISSE